jgi:Kef-type K+ transport system membrane component KefB
MRVRRVLARTGAGVVAGPAVLGWVEVGETVEVFAELGAVFLLFWVGLETKLDDLREVGATAGLVGAMGVVLPFAGGAGLAAALGEEAAVVQRRPGILKAPKFSESPLLPAVILCPGLAALSAKIGLAAIIGAFLAGMVVAETREQHPIEEEVAPLYAFFPPFFFAFIGLQLVPGEYTDRSTLALLAAVTLVAVVTKFAGAWLGARRLGPREAKPPSWASRWSRAARWGSSSRAWRSPRGRSPRSSLQSSSACRC